MAQNPNPMRPRANQTDKSFNFDGIDGTDRQYKQVEGGYTNHFRKTTGVEAKTNAGRGATTGNASSSPMAFRGAGNPTGEKTKKTIASAAQGRNTVYGGASRGFPVNSDKINAGNK